MKIEVNHVSKTINKTLILDDITLSLEGGKIYGLQGPNGSGKTMFLRLLAGLIRPSSGEVLIDGTKLGVDCDFPSSMGLLIENPAFLPNYTGIGNLELLADLQSKVNKNQIHDTLQRVGLNPNDSRKYRKYSLGMKQRLGIAAAIMERPDLILIDEPTNALDDDGIKQVCEIMRQERARGALIIFACHDAEIVRDLSDEVLKVNAGHIERKSGI